MKLLFFSFFIAREMRFPHQIALSNGYIYGSAMYETNFLYWVSVTLLAKGIRPVIHYFAPLSWFNSFHTSHWSDHLYPSLLQATIWLVPPFPSMNFFYQSYLGMKKEDTTSCLPERRDWSEQLFRVVRWNWRKNKFWCAELWSDWTQQILTCSLFVSVMLTARRWSPSLMEPSWLLGDV